MVERTGCRCGFDDGASGGSIRARTLHTAGEQRTIAVILATGDEAVACLMQLAAQEGITVAQFTAIGGFSSAVLGYFDWQTKEYRRNPVDEQVEVASLTGDIAEGEDGTPSLRISTACSAAGTEQRSAAI